MKRAYLTKGTLVAPAQSIDAVFAVDAVTWSYLQGLLGTDYCYLVVAGVEVIKVQSLEAPNLLLVARDVESTSRTAWPSGTVVTYGLTQSEVNDAVTYKGLTLTLQGNLQYDSGGNISYPPISMIGVGGVECEGDGFTWTLVDVTELGCESLVPLVPPPIPPQYQPYRICDPSSGPDYRVLGSGDNRMYI